MKNIKFLGQHFGADGSMHFLYRGMTPVSSIWSDGLRRTRFVVSFYQDGTMDIKADGHSRQPYYRDVLEALSGLLGTTPIKKLNLSRRQPRIGADWISCGRFDARINEEGHMSLRDRKDAWHMEFAGTVPVGFMKEAMSELFALGEELESVEPEQEEVFTSEAERFEMENNRVLFEGRPIASCLGN